MTEKPKMHRYDVYNFDPKTRRIESVDTFKTRPMLKAEAKEVIKRRIANYKGSAFCYSAEI